MENGNCDFRVEAGTDHKLGAALNWTLTIFLDVLTAAVNHPGDLPVDGIEAQPLVPVLLLLVRCFSWQGQLQRLQEAGLVVVQVSDGVHRHSSLWGRKQ